MKSYSASHSVLIIERNLDIIKIADWLIDQGPDGGDRGGEFIAEGTHEHVADVSISYTGQQVLRAYVFWR